MTIDLFLTALLSTFWIGRAWSEFRVNAISSIGNTTINGLNVIVDVECNSKFILVCEIKPYVGTATWEIDGKNAAVCVADNCYQFPPFPLNHTTFLMNISTGEFAMFINPVTIAAKGKTYKCKDGQTAKSMKGVVKVFPTEDTLKIEIIDSYEEKTITVMTGCVSPYNETDLRFEWFSSNKRISPEKIESLTNNQTVSINNCTETSCDGLQTAYFNNTLAFNVYESGERYYICVKVAHVDALSLAVEICSKDSFILKEGTCKKIKMCDCCVCKIVILIFGALDVILFLLLLIANRCDCLRKRIKDKERYLHFLCSIIIISAVLILIGLIVYIICICYCYDDSCPCCMKFKWIGWVFSAWLFFRLVLGIIVICVICHENSCKDFLNAVVSITIEKFEFILFYISPVLNIVITIRCWPRIHSKLYLKTDTGKVPEVHHDKPVNNPNLKNKGENKLSANVTHLPHPDNCKTTEVKALPKHQARLDNFISKIPQAEEPDKKSVVTSSAKEQDQLHKFSPMETQTEQPRKKSANKPSAKDKAQLHKTSPKRTEAEEPNKKSAVTSSAKDQAHLPKVNQIEEPDEKMKTRKGSGSSHTSPSQINVNVAQCQQEQQSHTKHSKIPRGISANFNDPQFSEVNVKE